MAAYTSVKSYIVSNCQTNHIKGANSTRVLLLIVCVH